jgi:hypothetical protein
VIFIFKRGSKQYIQAIQSDKVPWILTTERPQCPGRRRLWGDRRQRNLIEVKKMQKLKRIVIIVLGLILVLVAGGAIVFYVGMKPYRQLAESWVFKENRGGPVIGDLGGIPVSIPQPIARFVEYENDPHFLEKRKGSTPTRTFQSKLRAFGFEVRFPDMVFLNDEATREEKRKSNIYNSMWLDVGVDVESYNDDLSLKRLVDAIPAPGKIWTSNLDGQPHNWKEQHGYIRSPKPFYNLVVNEVQGYDEAKRYKLPGNDFNDKNIYYHINQLGKMDTYIWCSNIKHQAAPCEHYFVLPRAKNTLIEVGYRIGLLPKWREIQDSVGKTILDFAGDPNTNSQTITPKPTVHTGDK